MDGGISDVAAGGSLYLLDGQQRDYSLDRFDSRATPLPLLSSQTSLIIRFSAMAHRRTFSARFPDMRNVSLDSPPLTPIPNIAGLPIMTSRKPRAYWLRTTFLALFVLVVVSVYVLLVSPPVLRPISFRDAERARPDDPARPSRWTPEAFRLAALKHRKPNATGGSSATNDQPQIALNQTQELAAVSSFIASLPQNMIPSSIDPSIPIDPQLVLDFDTRGPHAEEELQAVIRDVWSRNPVMLYSKVRVFQACGLVVASARAHHGLRSTRRYHERSSRSSRICTCALRPRLWTSTKDVSAPPFLAQRGSDVNAADENVLVPLLFRLTSSKELPILLIGGHTVGTAQEIKYLAAKGQLSRLITEAGGVVDGARKKKAKKL